MGRITWIRYERIAKLGDFKNSRIVAEQTVDPGEDPDEVYQQLRKWVRSKCIEDEQKAKGKRSSR